MTSPVARDAVLVTVRPKDNAQSLGVREGLSSSMRANCVASPDNVVYSLSIMTPIVLRPLTG